MALSIEDTRDAVTELLYLALIAPDDERAARATTLAERLAVGLTEADITLCKWDALAKADEADEVTE